MNRWVGILRGITRHYVLRCPACETLNLEFTKDIKGIAIMCSNRNCGMTGPHRKRAAAAVGAWNDLPRKMPSNTK